MLHNWHRTIVTRMVQHSSNVIKMAKQLCRTSGTVRSLHEWHRTTVTQLARYDLATHMAQHNNNRMQTAERNNTVTQPALCESVTCMAQHKLL